MLVDGLVGAHACSSLATTRCFPGPKEPPFLGCLYGISLTAAVNYTYESVLPVRIAASHSANLRCGHVRLLEFRWCPVRPTSSR